MGRTLAPARDGRRLLFVDQKPAATRAPPRAREFRLRGLSHDCRGARRGGDKLAVDGVLVIGEHGDYPVNDKGQILYPRYEFFEPDRRRLRADGRSVPVFNDKHLSYSFDKATRMVEASKRLGFPMLAGSSLPVTWRLPPIELPSMRDRRSADGRRRLVRSDGLYALEAMQSMLERRRNGETGVQAVQLIQGPAVWKAGQDGRWSRRLLEAAFALHVAHGRGLVDGRTPESHPQRRTGATRQGPGGLFHRVSRRAAPRS